MPLIIGPTVRYAGRPVYVGRYGRCFRCPLLEPDIRAALEVFPLPPINDETLPIMRPALAAPGPELSHRVVRSVVHAPSAAGAPDVALRLHRPKGAACALPCLVWMHGGGLVGMFRSGRCRQSARQHVRGVLRPARGPRCANSRRRGHRHRRRTGGAFSVFRGWRRTSRCADSPRAAEYLEYGRRGLIRR